jgi:hypothetical protein
LVSFSLMRWNRNACIVRAAGTKCGETTDYANPCSRGLLEVKQKNRCRAPGATLVILTANDSKMTAGRHGRRRHQLPAGLAGRASPATG